MKKPTKQIVAGGMALLMLALTPQSALAEEITGGEMIVDEDKTGAEETTPAIEEEILELSADVKGMPSDYVPDEEELAEKVKMTEHYGNPDSFEDLTEGVDYIENEIWFLADTKEYAVTVAEAYSGTLKSFEYGVATVRLDPEILTVEEAVRLGADPESNFPVVSPNFINVLEEPEMEGDSEDDPGVSPDTAAVGDGRLRYGWEEWFEDAIDSGVNIDPALYPNYQDEKEGYSYQWMHDMIHTWQAWQEAPNLGKGVTVAVIDTNVLDTHEDLKGRVTADRSVKSDWGDASGHGTHVAGIIAASKGNGLGGSGIAPNASILGIPIFSVTEDGKEQYVNEDLAKGMNRAVEAKVDIINLSIGSPKYDAELEEVLKNAYQKGITVCAAMMNDRANNRRYPAAFADYVIAVAAVDENGSRSEFSSYGDWADIAAPGADIFSTCVSGTSKDASYASTKNVYKLMSGTSMATPVIAGVCALYMGEKGHVSPDEMLRVLKANVNNESYAKKAQIGAGIIDLTNMFDSDTPEAPSLYINNRKAGSAEEIEENAILSLQTGYETESFLYTLNGKSPAVKGGVLTNGIRIEAAKKGSVYLAEIGVADLLGSGEMEPGKTTTIKACAVVPGGRIGAEGSFSLTVKKEKEVYRIDVTGQTGIMPGKTAAYKAELLPKNLKKKTVTWSLDGAPDGVSIDKTGKIKVEKSVPSGSSFLVVATADADEGGSGSLPVTIIEQVASVALTADEITKTPQLADYREHVYIPSYKKDVLQSVRLFTVDIPDETVTVNGKSLKNDTKENVLKLSANGGDTTHPYLFKSSNPKVASVDAEGTVTAISEGKATITCTADDGSKKKASVRVNVIVPASGIYLKSNDSTDVIGMGKTQKLTAVLGNAYGTPTVKKTGWDLKAYGCDMEGERTDITSSVKNGKQASVTGGKLSAGKGLQSYLNNYAYTELEPQAFTTDGTGSIDEAGKFIPRGAEDEFTVIMATKKIFIYFNDPNYGWYEIGKTVQRYSFPGIVDSYTLIASVYSNRIYPNGLGAFAVTSSNPSVASAYANGSSLVVSSISHGKTTIKVRALDGSNVSRSFTVQVE